MFAFVMAGSDGRFVAARDPVGIKPLYWARRGDTVRFASEMHAFAPEWQPAVEPFPPGCSWTPEDGLARFASRRPRRARAAAGPEEPGAPLPEALLAGTRETLVRAVEQQLMGDVPVGVFLSGGLDSSLVAAIAARAARRHGRTLQTFAVGTPDSPDLAAAREAAEHLRDRAPRDHLHGGRGARVAARRRARDRVLRPRAWSAAPCPTSCSPA